MKQFFVTLPRNLLGCFAGRKPIWHVIAILFTLILVLSGFDWRYYLVTRSPELSHWMWPAVLIGGILPFYLPLFLLGIGCVSRNVKVALTGWAVAQAEIIGALIVIACKAFTGRAHPAPSAGVDISRVFHFGFLRGGVFWGWPSSHTAVAFAMAAAICTVWPKQWWLGFMAVLYAFYIGFGVSMTIHWYSDFVAGAIIGSVAGMVVGKSFSETSHAPHSTFHTESARRGGETLDVGR